MDAHIPKILTPAEWAKKENQAWLLSFASLFFFAAVPYFDQKITHFTLPQGDLSLFQMLALAANVIVIVPFILQRTLLPKAKNNQERYTYYLLSWRPLDLIMAGALVATYKTLDGNGFFIAANLFIALIGVLLTRPTSDQKISRT